MYVDTVIIVLANLKYYKDAYEIIIMIIIIISTCYSTSLVIHHNIH